MRQRFGLQEGCYHACMHGLEQSCVLPKDQQRCTAVGLQRSRGRECEEDVMP